MTSTQTAPDLTYPTPAMQSLIHDIRTDICFMQQWSDISQDHNPWGAMTEVTPGMALATLEKIVESTEPALRFFLNYPTQRLSVFLIYFVDTAESCVFWLGSHHGVSRDPSLSVEMYQRSCERLHSSIMHWRNALVLAGLHFDADTPEIQH